MHRDTRNAQGAADTAPSTTSASRWLALAVALCGALAGGSIVEAIAAVASQTSMPVSPDHLIAEPLVLAGALCGGLLAALLASTDQYKDRLPTQTSTDLFVPVDGVPAEPMMWQPAPPLPHVTQLTTTTALLPARSTRHAIRIYRRTHQGTTHHRAGRIIHIRPPIRE
jgi:hypothetical protein